MPETKQGHPGRATLNQLGCFFRISPFGTLATCDTSMKTKIHPADLRRLEYLRALYKARLREIVDQLGIEPGNMSLLLEAEGIRQKFYEMQSNWEGGAA
jgi:hypothetical protein